VSECAQKSHFRHANDCFKTIDPFHGDNVVISTVKVVFPAFLLPPQNGYLFAALIPISSPYPVIRPISVGVLDNGF